MNETFGMNLEKVFVTQRTIWLMEHQMARSRTRCLDQGLAKGHLYTDIYTFVAERAMWYVKFTYILGS